MNIREKSNASGKDSNDYDPTLRILTNSNFNTEELRKIDLTDGEHKIEIIVNNQILKLPGKYMITDKVKSLIKNINGVNEIKFI